MEAPLENGPSGWMVPSGIARKDSRYTAALTSQSFNKGPSKNSSIGTRKKLDQTNAKIEKPIITLFPAAPGAARRPDDPNFTATIDRIKVSTLLMPTIPRKTRASNKREKKSSNPSKFGAPHKQLPLLVGFDLAV